MKSRDSAAGKGTPSKGSARKNGLKAVPKAEMTKAPMGPVRDAMLSRMFVRVMKDVLENAIRQSETAVMQITENLQNVGSLSAKQKADIAQAFESYYESDEGRTLKEGLNDAATAIMEAAARGDMAAVDAISSTAEYQNARKATKRLHDSLQGLLHADDELSEMLGPVLVSLQFQDSTRQELESVSKTFDDYFSYVSGLQEVAVTDVEAGDFWRKVSRNFTNIDSRKRVLKSAFGEEYEADEKELEGLAGAETVFL